MKNEWIPIEQELPKTEFAYHSIPIQIYKPNKHLPKKYWVTGCFYSKEEGFHTDEGLTYSGVTHWAHLLPPPKK